MQLNIIPESNLTTTNNQFHLLSINEVRKILKVRHSTVNELVQDGKLKAVKISKRLKIPEFRLQEFIVESSQIESAEKKELRSADVKKQIDELVNRKIRRVNG